MARKNKKVDRRSQQMKIDDASWHGATVPLPQAAAHIAPVFIWLISKGYIELEIDVSRGWRKELADRRMSPAEFFDYFSDSKLVVDNESEIANFLNECYMERYVPLATEEYSLTRNSKFDEPYDLEDNWDNSDQIGVILDKLLEEWRSERMTDGHSNHDKPIKIGHAWLQSGMVNVTRAGARPSKDEEFDSWPKDDFKYIRDTYALVDVKAFSDDGVVADVDLFVAHDAPQGTELVASFDLNTSSRKVYVGDVLGSLCARFNVPEKRTEFQIYLDSKTDMNQVYVIFDYAEQLVEKASWWKRIFTRV